MKISYLFCFVVIFLQACTHTKLVQQTDFTLETARQIEARAWSTQPDAILARIQAPSFREEVYDIREFGARDDSTFDSRPAILRAIREASNAGGGKVVLPKGYWFSNGPIHLQSNINLHLEAGALLKFGNDPTRYTPLVKVRWEGTICWNWSPLIYAYQQENIALTGKGTIDGNGRRLSIKWRRLQNPEKNTLRKMGSDLVPEDQRVFGNGFLDRNGDGRDDGFGDGKTHYLRPTLIEFYECKNILIEGLTLEKSPFWTVHPVFSQNVICRDLRIFGGILNDDGIDPDSCEDVLIEGCFIQTHDDAIAIKAGRDQDAWQRPKCRNIIVRNCSLNSEVNSFCIGSEMSGGVEDVFVENCHIIYGRHGMNFKCNLDRGGQVQRIFLRNITIDSLQDAMFSFRMDYHGYRGNNFPTKFNDIYAGNIQCKYVEKLPFKLIGVKAEPIRRLYLHDISITAAGEDSQTAFVKEVLTSRVRIGSKAWNVE